MPRYQSFECPKRSTLIALLETLYLNGFDTISIRESDQLQQQSKRISEPHSNCETIVCDDYIQNEWYKTIHLAVHFFLQDFEYYCTYRHGSDLNSLYFRAQQCNCCFFLNRQHDSKVSLFLLYQGLHFCAQRYRQNQHE